MRRRWRGRIVNGLLCMENADEYQAYLSTLEGREVAVVVTRWTRTTSNPQYAYYYGVVLKLLSDHTGFTRDEMDDILKDMFLYEYATLPSGQLIRKKISKTVVTTKEFAEFIEEVKRWASIELGVVIPDPDEVEYREDVYESG